MARALGFVTVESVAHRVKVRYVHRSKFLLPERHHRAVHHPLALFLRNKERVKVKYVALAGNAARDDDGARARALAHRERQRAHVGNDFLRGLHPAAVLEAEALHAARDAKVVRQRADDAERRLGVYLARRHADQEAQKVHRACGQAVPNVRSLRLGGQAGGVLGEHAHVHRALAQVGRLALETLVERARDARVALRAGRLLALGAAVKADAADAAAPLRRGEAVLARRHATSTCARGLGTAEARTKMCRRHKLQTTERTWHGVTKDRFGPRYS